MKFKVGDRITHRNGTEIMTITEVHNDYSYRVEYEDGDWDLIDSFDDDRLLYFNMPELVDELIII